MTNLMRFGAFQVSYLPPNFNISFLLNISLKCYFNDTLSYSQNLLNCMEEQNCQIDFQRAFCSLCLWAAE